MRCSCLGPPLGELLLAVRRAESGFEFRKENDTQNNNQTLRDDVRSYALEMLCELMTDDDFLIALKRVTDSAVDRSTMSYLDDDIVAANHESIEAKRELIDIINNGGFDR